MQRLRQLAEAESGVPHSAVEEARQAKLYERIGRDKLASLSEAFYTRVYADEQWFRGLFANTTRDVAVQNQREFFAQEFGGPREYEARKGHTALLGRHGPYAVDENAGRRWLKLMMLAIEDVSIDGECKQLLSNYMQHMAWFVVHGRKLVSGMRTVGYYGKHAEGQA